MVADFFLCHVNSNPAEMSLIMEVCRECLVGVLQFLFPCITVIQMLNIMQWCILWSWPKASLRSLMLSFDVCLGPILNMNVKSFNTKGFGNASTEFRKKKNPLVCAWLPQLGWVVSCRVHLQALHCLLRQELCGSQANFTLSHYASVHTVHAWQAGCWACWYSSLWSLWHIESIKLCSVLQLWDLKGYETLVLAFR